MNNSLNSSQQPEAAAPTSSVPNFMRKSARNVNKKVDYNQVKRIELTTITQPKERKPAVKRALTENIAENAVWKMPNIRDFERWTKSIDSDMKDIPQAIDYLTLHKVELREGFRSRDAATRAAHGLDRFARLLGTIPVHLINITPDILESLIMDLEIKYARGKGTPKQVFWDDDGEFNMPIGQIPISRIVDMEYSNTLHFHEEKDKLLCNTLLGLQSPITSAWKRPFIRVISSYTYIKEQLQLKINYFVYATRLLFELIADESIKYLICKITPHPSVIVEKCTNMPAKCNMFTLSNMTNPTTTTMTTSTSRASNITNSVNTNKQFSIDGLLQHAENRGYPITRQQPTSLTVDLFEFQLSTYNWMYAQETLPGLGINSLYWECWKLQDGGGDLYYFPLGGEFRLDPPPTTRGGLLAEEMGLGKTVEILSIILGNPFNNNTLQSILAENGGQMNITDVEFISKATLIVVPPILLPQWWREIENRVQPNTLRILNLSRREIMFNRYETTLIPIEDLLISSPNHYVLPDEWGNLKPHLSGEVFHHIQAVARFSWAPGETIPVKVLQMRGNNIVKVKFSARDLLLSNKHDIIITTYDSFRSEAGAYKNIHWHRVVIDECQEIKSSTSDIALQCANLKTSYRWMVSGTPFVSSIEDLHGELQFLRIWPFCLSDHHDGFWEKKIGTPFQQKVPESLVLLHSLIDGVMMRHCKSQRYIHNNEPLVQIPSRIVEWKGYDVTYSSEIYLYKYLEEFAASALRAMLHAHRNNNNVDNGGNNYQDFSRMPNFVHLKSCMSFMSQCLSHPNCIDLRKLDNLRRRLLPAFMMVPFVVGAPQQHQPFNINNIVRESYGVPKLTAEQALQRLQMIGAGIGGGFNHDSHRRLGNTAISEKEVKLVEELGLKDVPTLRHEVELADLPVPMSWQTLKFRISIENGSSMITCYYIPDVKMIKELSLLKCKLLSNMVKIGDIIRLAHADQQDAELEIVSVVDKQDVTETTIMETIKSNQSTNQQLQYAPVEIGVIKTHKIWSEENIQYGLVYKHIYAPRAEPYIQLLVAKAMLAHIPNFQKKSNDIHEVGFETLYKLIGGRAVECPLCLTSDAIRPTVTKCVHVHCFGCIIDVILRERNIAKCPCCRRPVTMNTLIEIEVANISAEEQLDSIPSATTNVVSKSSGSTDVGENKEHPSSSSSSSTLSPFSRTTRAEANITSSNPPVLSSSSTSTTAPTAPTTSSHVNKVPSLSSSASQQQQEKAHDSTCIVPELHRIGIAATSEDLSRIPFPHVNLRNRVADLPSIDPLPLTHFGLWGQNNGFDFSGRFTAILEDMSTVLRSEPTSKFVIFSQYNETLQILKKKLEVAYPIRIVMKCAMVNSTMNSMEKERNLKLFSDDPSYNICLLLLGSASSGLTLTVASVCYIMEPTHSAADEAQALNRVHRIGQTKSTRCVIFYAKNTVEERLLAIRQSKRMLSELIQGNICTSEAGEGGGVDSEMPLDHARRRDQHHSSGFFNKETLKILYGVSTEHDEEEAGGSQHSDDDDDDSEDYDDSDNY